jgi:hypothetical protein
MESNRMFELAHGLAVAKSRQDLAAAMKLRGHDVCYWQPNSDMAVPLNDDASRQTLSHPRAPPPYTFHRGHTLVKT